MSSRAGRATIFASKDSGSRSIHCGVATSNYAFIWGMCGENQEFDDMDNIDPRDLK